MKWLKRILLLVALLLACVLIFCGVAMHYLQGTPEYYRTYSWSFEERSRLNSQALHKLLEAQNMIAGASAAEVRSVRAGAPATQTSQGTRITLTEEELNALLKHDFEPLLAAVVAEPAVFLVEGRIILAGKIRELGLDCLASARFKPAITENGRLRLELESVLGGRLPLPQILIDAQTDRARRRIDARLPAWKMAAQMDSRGACNLAFVQASLAETLLACLDKTESEPVVYIPDDAQRSLPAKITEINIENHVITVTVQSLGPQERAELARSVTGH